MDEDDSSQNQPLTGDRDMNASWNRTRGWLKAVLGLVLGAGLVGFNTGCLERYFGFEPGAHNFPGMRNPAVNPAGNGVWEDPPLDLPLSSHSSPSSRLASAPF